MHGNAASTGVGFSYSFSDVSAPPFGNLLIHMMKLILARFLLLARAEDAASKSLGSGCMDIVTNSRDACLHVPVLAPAFTVAPSPWFPERKKPFSGEALRGLKGSCLSHNYGHGLARVGPSKTERFSTAALR